MRVDPCALLTIWGSRRPFVPTRAHIRVDRRLYESLSHSSGCVIGQRPHLSLQVSSRDEGSLAAQRAHTSARFPSRSHGIRTASKTDQPMFSWRTLQRFFRFLGLRRRRSQRSYQLGSGSARNTTVTGTFGHLGIGSAVRSAWIDLLIGQLPSHRSNAQRSAESADPEALVFGVDPSLLANYWRWEIAYVEFLESIRHDRCQAHPKSRCPLPAALHPPPLYLDAWPRLASPYSNRLKVRNSQPVNTHSPHAKRHSQPQRLCYRCPLSSSLCARQGWRVQRRCTALGLRIAS